MAKAAKKAEAPKEKENTVEMESGEQMSTEQAQNLVDMHKNINYVTEPADLAQARKIIAGK